MVEAFGVQDVDEQGTQTGQTARLRVDALLARLDRCAVASMYGVSDIDPSAYDLRF